MVNKKDMRFKKRKVIMWIVIGIILLGVVLINLENIKIKGLAILGNEIAQQQKICKSECKSEDRIAFCCNMKIINDEVNNCQQNVLKTNCEIYCAGICENYCSSIEYMVPCAEAGCSWAVRGGYCKARRWV